MKFLKLYLEASDEFYAISPFEESTIDAAVERYLTSAGNPDTLLHLTTMEDETFTVRASSIVGWQVVTPEGRERYWARHKMIEAVEDKARKAAGIWDE